MAAQLIDEGLWQISFGTVNAFPIDIGSLSPRGQQFG
jgi:hypothetical protein